MNDCKLPDTGFIRLKAVLHHIPVGKSSWWAGVKEGKYPKPIKIGQNITVWRSDEIQALILSTKLEGLAEDNTVRQSLASRYYELLKDVSFIKLPPLPTKTDQHVWHLFVVEVSNRAAFMQFLKEHGVETMCHYPVPPHQQEAYKELSFDLPKSEQIHANTVSLPIGPTMTTTEVEYVCDIIKKYGLIL